MVWLPVLSATLQSKPNVIIFFCDDLGFNEIGPFGQMKIPTPNLDLLAREGKILKRFYTASPVCAPSRASLMTGKHTGHSPIRGNSEVGGWELNEGEGQISLPSNEITLAKRFKSVGYQTAALGKWGMGAPGSEGVPNKHGFDYFFGYLCQRKAHNHYPAYLWENQDVYLLTGNSYFRPQKRITAAQATPEMFASFIGKQYAPDEITGKATTWIDKNHAKPFFMYFATTLPHTSLQAPQEAVDKFPKEWDTTPYLGENGYVPCARPRATYAAMIAKIDDEVGALRAALKKNGLDRNTLILFTSDNGTTFLKQVDRQFFGSLGDLRGTKSTCYEGGIKMPAIAWWPGQIKPGTSSEQFMYTCDLTATLGSIAGFASKGTDGVDVLKSFTGNESVVRPPIYFEFPEELGYQAVIMDSRYKAILPETRRGNKKIEVYDLIADPNEKSDLAQKRPDLVKKGKALIDANHIPNKVFPLPGIDTPAVTPKKVPASQKA